MQIQCQSPQLRSSHYDRREGFLLLGLSYSESIPAHDTPNRSMHLRWRHNNARTRLAPVQAQPGDSAHEGESMQQKQTPMRTKTPRVVARARLHGLTFPEPAMPADAKSPSSCSLRGQLRASHALDSVISMGLSPSTKQHWPPGTAAAASAAARNSAPG